VSSRARVSFSSAASTTTIGVSFSSSSPTSAKMSSTFSDLISEGTPTFLSSAGVVMSLTSTCFGTSSSFSVTFSTSLSPIVAESSFCSSSSLGRSSAILACTAAKRSSNSVSSTIDEASLTGLLSTSVSLACTTCGFTSTSSVISITGEVSSLKSSLGLFS